MRKLMPILAVLYLPVLAAPTSVSAAAASHTTLENSKSERVMTKRQSDAIRLSQRCFNYGGQVKCF